VGTVPAYRDISPKTTGADVRQFFTFLMNQGYAAEQTDTYSPYLAEAVKAWQADNGYIADGIVRASDLIWFPRLPRLVYLDAKELTVGNIVSRGVGDISVAPSVPRFRLRVDQDAARDIVPGLDVVIHSPKDGDWRAITGDQTPASDDPNTSVVRLESKGGNVICEKQCANLGVNGNTQLSAEVVTVPKKTGLVVPASAIKTGATPEDTFVIEQSGKKAKVTLLQSARGLCLVDGLRAGQKIRAAPSQKGNALSP
jgi:peptidoglycan hydrolase-like protein with peptidoglycan-binding domain